MSNTLLTAIVAATAALLGAIVGQFGTLLQHRLARQHERRALLLDRYEQMATLASELSVHLARKVDEMHSDRRVAPTYSADELVRDSLRMHMLALLYFPELLSSMTTLRYAATALESALRKSAEEANVALEGFLEARRNATAAIGKYAGRYS